MASAAISAIPRWLAPEVHPSGAAYLTETFLWTAFPTFPARRSEEEDWLAEGQSLPPCHDRELRSRTIRHLVDDSVSSMMHVHVFKPLFCKLGSAAETALW